MNSLIDVYKICEVASTTLRQNPIIWLSLQMYFREQF